MGNSGTSGRVSEIEPNLAIDQLRLALRNLLPNHWLMPVFVGVSCLIFQFWIARPILILWIVTVAFGAAPLGYVSARFLAFRPEELPRHWIKAAIFAHLLFCIASCEMGILFWRSGNDPGNMLILVVIAWMFAGNSAIAGASKPLAINGYGTYGALLVLLPLVEGGPVYTALSLLALIFVGYLIFVSRQTYFTARDMLRLRDHKNELIGALEKSKRESEIAREYAEAASRAKSEFLANMSHELRTPLNAILGFSEIIYSGQLRLRSGQCEEYAQIIHRSGQHLLALIDDVLDLSKIEAGKMQLHEGRIAVSRLFAECVRVMAARAEAGSISVHCDVPASIPDLKADERALKQILLNLLSNAVKFTPPGGQVIGFARVEADGRMAVGVIDTGIGICAQDQQRVFQSFGQGRHDIVKFEKGTGLGLPIVKGLAEAHGGSVKLQSRVGEGTRVTIRFPAARVEKRRKLRAA